MLASKGRMRRTTSLLDDYVDRYSDAAVRRRASVALRAARVEAELAYRARGEFLANMNHELRTPLNAIVGFANMMKEAENYGLSKEQISEYLDYILQSAELLLTHINTILDLAAAESGGAKITRRPVSTEELFSEAVEKFQHMADRAGVTLTFSTESGLPEIEVDPDRIDTAFSHLLENAITYSREGGEVSVMVRKGRVTGDKNWVYVAIQDEGEGMTDEELARALKSFEQVHQGLHRKFEGSGIGLPVARAFIELNGGKFDVKSRRGEGTTVRFALPAEVNAEAPVIEGDRIDQEQVFKEAG